MYMIMNNFFQYWSSVFLRRPQKFVSNLPVGKSNVIVVGRFCQIFVAYLISYKTWTVPGRNQSHFRIQRFCRTEWHGWRGSHWLKLHSMIWFCWIFLVIDMTTRIGSTGITGNGCVFGNWWRIIVDIVITVCYLSAVWIH